MTALFCWRHKLDEIPRRGVSERRKAGDNLRRTIAKELGVQACIRLIAEYTIRNAGGGRFELKGTLDSEFSRVCVVSLSPITDTIKESLDCIFVPPEHLPERQSEEEEALAVEEIEPITQEAIEVGRIIYEVISATLDPYPRAHDAELELFSDSTEQVSRENPFAALQKLKDDSNAQS
jgi:uncharacterized metal-binding protein YceD (DUF177 family)